MWDLEFNWDRDRVSPLVFSRADALEGERTKSIRRFHPPSDDVTEGGGHLRKSVVRRPPWSEHLRPNVRGAWDSGVVWYRSVARGTHDLRPGDARRISPGEIPFINVPGDDVLEIVCSRRNIRPAVQLKDDSSDQDYPQIPVLSNYMWVDRHGRPTSPPQSPFEKDTFATSPMKRTPSYRETKEGTTFKKIILVVDNGLSLGLMIRGGAEYGLGIYVTGVDPGSAADLAGLQIGDQILSLNDHDFTSITHDDAVELMQTSPRMTMLVRSVGKVPHSAVSNSFNPVGGGGVAGSWYQERGNPKPHGLSRRGSSRKAEVQPEEILPPVGQDRAEHRLERKSKKLLTESQRISLGYYCNEYETGAMTVEAFVGVLMEFLDAPEKHALVTEIRAWIRDEDLDKFDDLVYRREILPNQGKETMKLSVEIHADDEDVLRISPKETLKGFSPRGSFRASARRRQQQKIPPDVHHLSVPDANDEMLTPSEDSGVDLANGTLYGLGSRKGSRVSTGSRDSVLDPQLQRKGTWKSSRSGPRRSFDAMSAMSTMREVSNTTRLRRTMLRRHSSGGEGASFDERRPFEDRRWSLGTEIPNHTATDGHLEAAQAVLSRLEAIALSRRRHSPNVPRPPPLSPHGALSMSVSPNSLQVPHVRVRRHRSLPDPHAIYARKKQQQLEQQQQQRSASVRLPGHRTIPEGNGRLRVIVKKTRSLLGIAIEGGVNTSQPLPRIISIHTSGAAFEAGGLKVGHVILEVDGIKLNRMSHHEVAQVIAQAFYSTDRDHVEFLVADTSKAELDQRRSSPLAYE